MPRYRPPAGSSRFDPVSRSQRTVYAEFERQRSRLKQKLRWYDHQCTARDTELRRQYEYLSKAARRQINYRSKVSIQERARLRYMLDYDEDQLPCIRQANHPTAEQRAAEDRKRCVYGCLLPQFKAPLGQSYDSWSRNPFADLSDHDKRLERQRRLIAKYTQSASEQRNRINVILDKCLSQLVECDSDGYDHFLRTSEPNRNAQVLAQQNNKQNTEKSNPVERR